MLGGTFVQQTLGEVFTFVCNVHVLFGEILGEIMLIEIVLSLFKIVKAYFFSKISALYYCIVKIY